MNEADIVVTADVRASGEKLFAQEQSVSAASGQGAGAGVVMFEIPTAELAPGQYGLRVTASSARERNQGVERRVAFEIVP
ncbi:MAG TPA: hypothetical protein VF198_08375 [Vicinamibacterales bacterium]